MRILAEAEAEAEAARQYLNARSLRVGSRFIIELRKTLEAIAATPTSFPRLETLPDDAPYQRALLAKFRYAVIFETISDEVVVVAVAHTSRAPDYWLGREP
ncbi:MAG: type II toxin-antitoxin system RelE/ParE family toxin [Planctomycetaceae bacterium]